MKEVQNEVEAHNEEMRILWETRDKLELQKEIELTQQES